MLVVNRLLSDHKDTTCVLLLQLFSAFLYSHARSYTKLCLLSLQEYVSNLFETYVNQGLQFVHKKCSQGMIQVRKCNVRTNDSTFEH